jgi:hypothetical protein
MESIEDVIRKLELHPDAKRRLRAVLKGQTQETWDAAYSIALKPDEMLTLWKAVCRVTMSYPQSKLPGRPWLLPTRRDIEAAIRYAAA